MMNDVSVRPLYARVKEALLHEIAEGTLSTADMLPAEQVLCESLRVSRSTLRRAVTALEQEGLLRRRQGIGTLIDRTVVNLGPRMDIKIEFSELLARAGYTPEVKMLDFREEAADQRQAESLRLARGTPVVSVTKLWLADGKPAILCTAIVPIGLFLSAYRPETFRQDIFTVLERLCGVQVDYQIATFIPLCLGKELASILAADEGTPAVSIEAVGYDADSTPVLYSTESHAPGILPFHLRRAKI